VRGPRRPPLSPVVDVHFETVHSGVAKELQRHAATPDLKSIGAVQAESRLPSSARGSLATLKTRPRHRLLLLPV